MLYIIIYIFHFQIENDWLHKNYIECCRSLLIIYETILSLKTEQIGHMMSAGTENEGPT